MSDSGRRRAHLIARLTNSTASANGKEIRLTTVSSSPGIPTVGQLKCYLWSAADILRGSIDSSDYKTYIFGLLFLKRLSDRFEEEAEKLVADGMSEDVAWTDPDEHQFFVPGRARWGTIQTTATNVGEALNKASAALEE